MQNTLDMANVNMSDFFHPPLPFDNDIMQGMQSFTDPALWQEMTALPGMYFAHVDCIHGNLMHLRQD